MIGSQDRKVREKKKYKQDKKERAHRQLLNHRVDVSLNRMLQRLPCCRGMQRWCSAVVPLLEDAVMVFSGHTAVPMMMRRSSAVTPPVRW